MSCRALERREKQVGQKSKTSRPKATPWVCEKEEACPEGETQQTVGVYSARWALTLVFRVSRALPLAGL